MFQDFERDLQLIKLSITYYFILYSLIFKIMTLINVAKLQFKIIYLLTTHLTIELFNKIDYT